MLSKSHIYSKLNPVTAITKTSLQTSRNIYASIATNETYMPPLQYESAPIERTKEQSKLKVYITSKNNVNTVHVVITHKQIKHIF